MTDGTSLGISSITRKLHWLLAVKLLLVTFEALHGQVAVYVAELLKPIQEKITF